MTQQRWCTEGFPLQTAVYNKLLRCRAGAGSHFVAQKSPLELTGELC